MSANREESATASRGFRMNDGDWVCPDKKCANVNFARRSHCNRCGKEKGQDARLMKTGGVEIGKALADKSKGLFSANDWQCRTCGNVNWARRMDCNMCGTPKYGKVEERTGYGGGFNEREDVEYIERDESDGEYDEFGRKKKKFRGQGPPVASILVTEGKKEEEDEEEEQNDLSKYKLEDEDEDKDKDKDKDEDEDESEDNEEEGDASKYDLAGSDSSGESGLSASRSSSRSSSRSHSLRRRSSQSPRRPSSHSRSGSSGSDTSIHHGSASTGEKERCSSDTEMHRGEKRGRRGEPISSARK